MQRVLARDLDERRATQPQVGDRHALFGLWPDRANGAYVTVYGARLVKHVSGRGGVTVVARSTWPWSPTGGLLAPDGALWLLETSLTNATRVRRIGADGQERIY